MITDYYINIESDWQNLPWQHINGRVALIQKKIFEASRQHNLKVLHKTQNSLLNSNEARLFAIDKIINSINKYYKLYNDEHYFSKDIDKFYLFKYLFNHNSILKVKLKFILEKIKEYLVYLCISPEWKARFQYLNMKDIHIDDSQLISCKVHIDHLKWNKIIYYTKYIPYISHHIYYWISNKFFIQDQYGAFKYLPNLLSKIDNLEIQWHEIKLIKWKHLFDYLNIKSIKQNKYVLYCLFTFKLKNYLFSYCYYLNNIIIEIKSKFYNKDYLNRLRINLQLKWLHIIQTITFILQARICKRIKLLNHSYIIHIINTINFLLSSLKICQNNHHIMYLLNYYKFNLFNMLYKKIIFNFLYKYLFKINR